MRLEKKLQTINPRVTIYTDGACSGNPGPGGWGARMIYKNSFKDISGYELDTTNNRMEMIAAIEALSLLKKKCDIDIFTDSMYLKNGMTVWIHNWVRNNWQKKHSKQLKNIELWEKLHDLSKKHNIIWHWVKGHASDEGNIVADSLAVEARKHAEKQLSRLVV
ncbi:MAG: ribonuclease HI [Rickettsiaceae bacterium]|nr:ribonuclease HI [Rickettsiaceae bacterium]